MSTPWMRLDTDFYLDPKIEALEKLRKAQGVYQWLKICCSASEHYGKLDINDITTKTHIEKHLGIVGKRLDSLVNDCVLCGLFDSVQWDAGIITSPRLLEEGEKRYRFEQQRVEAGKRSAESRKKMKEERKEGDKNDANL